MTVSNCDLVFGPRVNPSCRPFDFTLFFEDVILACIPAAIFLSFLPLQLCTLVRSPKVVKASSLLHAKLLSLASLSICEAAFLTLRTSNHGLHTNASLAADTLGLVATLGAGLLSWLDHQRSLRPSTLLTIYLSIFALLNLARLRTLWSITGAHGAAGTFTLIFGLTLLALFLESLSKNKGVLSPHQYRQYGSESFGGLWKRIGYAWLVSTVRRGYGRILTVDDLPNLDPQLRSSKLHLELEVAWNKDKRSTKNSLLRACFRAYAGAFFAAVIPRLCLSGFTYAQPFMINTLTNWIQDKSLPKNLGEGMIGAYALVYLGMAASTALYWYQTFQFLICLRGGLVSLIYQQTVQTRSVDMGDITGLTLMGTDVDRILVGFRTIHEVWASLLEMSIAVYLLERELGVACLIPGLIVLVFSLMTFKLSSWAKSSQTAWIQRVEKRLSVTSSMLENMKAVKMLGLAERMFDIIDHLQHVEVETSSKYRKNLIGQIFFSNSPSVLAPIVTFAVYVGIATARQDGSLLASRAFTSLSLISLLTTSALTFIQAIPSMIQCLGCFDRIQEFCTIDSAPPVEGGNLSRQSSKSPLQGSSIRMHDLGTTGPNNKIPGSTDPVVSFSEQSFGWGPDHPAVLKSLNLDIRAGRITVVLGPTASGKSTLLQSILDETVPLAGHTVRNFTTAAYCPQVSWLKAGTIRENIVGASLLDPDWYASVLHACGLEQDIKSLAAGDQTSVGSNGINVSGGQKQRISLARAVYSRRSPAILDDVFSGVDAPTTKIIATRLLGQDGLFRRNHTTVILATHSSVILPLADDSIVLSDGHVVKSGSVHSIRQTDTEPTTSSVDLQEEIGPAVQIQPETLVDLPESIADVIIPLEENQDADRVKRQQGDRSVYNYYSKSAGWAETISFLVAMILWTFCENFLTVWLDWWSDANTKNEGNNGLYLGFYASLGVAATVFMTVACWLLFISMISKSMRRFHQSLLRTVLWAPLYFFHDTDVGSITNRFSQDMELVGMDFPLMAVNYASAAFNCLAQVIMLAVFAKYLAVTAPFVIGIVFAIQRFYLRTSRQIRLLDIEAKAPLFLEFVETVAGSASIRAFGWQLYFRQAFDGLLDRSQRPVYLLYCVQQWLALLLDLIVAILAVLVVTIVVVWRASFDAGSVGVALVLVMTFNRTLMSVIKYWTMLETSVGSVSRIKTFVDTTEVEEHGNRGPPAEDWPLSGDIMFTKVVASHKPGASPALKNVSISIKAGDKVAICGRSGSGKTSLILSLLQMTSMQDGAIDIDGLSISAVDPNELRQRVNVVPQEPFLIPGSIRLNLDPYKTVADDAIIKALTKLGLWNRIEAAGGLEREIDQAAWSVGEKQLLCLARAMVRRSRLLVLDEAMSSVDHDTETIMQDAIDTEFSNCTVLAVMHRLGSIRKFDKVLVLEDGQVAEYDSPAVLLAKDDSRLAALYKASGSV